MYQSIFKNTSTLKHECSDDEYDFVFRLWSLMIRFGLQDDVQDFREEIDLTQELDDYARRCRLEE